jgi:hypothetical protein
VHTPQNQNTKQQQKKESLAQSQKKKKLVTERTGVIPQHTIFLVREEEKTLHKTSPFLNSFNPNRFFLSTKTDHTSTKAPELESAVVAAVLLITVNTRDLQQKQGLRKKLEKPKKK